MSQNPYANRYPLESPEGFYGHDRLLELLIHRLFRAKPAHSQQVVGLARMGKTSLLNVIACLNQPDYYESFAKKFDLEREFLKRVLFVKVNFGGLSKGEPSLFWNMMYERLIETEAHVPGMGLGSRGLANEHVTFEFFSRKLFSMLQNFMVIFLFDAFDRVIREGHRDISHNLRFLLEESKGRIVYITATSRTLYEYYRERADAQDVAPLFSYFDTEPFYLGSLEASESQGVRDFITDPAARCGITFTKEDQDFAIYQGGRHPDLTRIVCKRLFENYQYSEGRRGEYKTLYRQLVDECEPLYQRTRGELSPSQLPVLVRLADGMRLTEAQQRIQDTLVKLGMVLEEEGGGYRVFSPLFEEFLAREKLEASSELVPAHQIESEDEAVASGLTVWEDQRAVKVGDKLVVLSPNEWRLFTYLWKHANRVCTRNELIQALSSEDADFTAAALDITISRLRQKIEYEPEKPRIIVTVRGRGYRFEGGEVMIISGEEHH